MLVFTQSTIYSTVGTLISSMKRCKKTAGMKNLRKEFLVKVYDKNANMVARYTDRQEGVFKAIAKEMHLLGEGKIEGTCLFHPKR
jgi:hypothetical protein